MKKCEMTFHLKPTKKNSSFLQESCDFYKTVKEQMLSSFKKKKKAKETINNLDKRTPEWMKKTAMKDAEKAHRTKNKTTESITCLYNNSTYKFDKKWKTVTLPVLKEDKWEEETYRIRGNKKNAEKMIKMENILLSKVENEWKLTVYGSSNEELEKEKEKKDWPKWVYYIIFAIFFAIFAYAAMILLNWNKDNQKISKLEKEIKDKVEIKEETTENDNVTNINPPDDQESDYWKYIHMPLISVDFNELLKINKDTVGWIKVNGTNINYPIVQAKDNDYYLNHAFDGYQNSAGWVYADYRNDFKKFDDNTVIYGHGRLDTTIFGSLKNILTKSWQNNKDNYIVKLSTPTENSLWQVFSIYTIKAESYYTTTDFFGDDQTHQRWLDTMKERSILDFNTTVNTNDKVITLSTCKDNNNNRIVLHAKMIKKEVR